MNSLNLKNTSLLNFSFEWIARLIFWILFDDESFVQSLEKKMTLRVRIRDEKTSWRWRLSFTIVNVFFHASNHASFMQEMLVLRIIDREDNHFDRFRIHVEFFVWFFLKFIENDYLSWMKNAVNRKWWMRKWIVKKTKMRHKWVLSLKESFFLFVFDQVSLSLCLRICYSLCLSQKFFLKLSSCRSCEILSLLISTWSSLIVFCRSLSRSSSTRTRDRDVVNDASSFWSRILFSSVSSTWVVSCVIVASVSMLRAWR